MNPKDYLNGIRISKAKEFLANPKLRIREVANRVGVPPNIFCQWFKQNMEMTPEEYRQKNGGNDSRENSPKTSFNSS